MMSQTSLRIAVVGTGIAGLSAAWLLSQSHEVTVFEAGDHVGGHSNTVDVALHGRAIAVDTGFIVYNEPAYPNLTALFAHLGVATKPTEMSFSVSLDGGALEYAGNNLSTLFAQKKNLFSARFWSMLRDLRRFYAEAPRDLPKMGEATLGAYLDANGYGAPFREDHLYPMAAAIWSIPARQVAAYPAAAFVRFCDNHGLLQITGRPIWRTVEGGSRSYVKVLTAPFAERIEMTPVRRILREEDGARLYDAQGEIGRFDHVVVAAHADDALALLGDASDDERRILGCFPYSRNETFLHSDPALMPKRRPVWSSWNYLAARGSMEGGLSVTYWMNRLQGLPPQTPLFVTLNPIAPPRADLILKRLVYEHPIFDRRAIAAQRELWSLQGVRRTWFCGAYFGSGFHEDGLQAGLAVAEQLGGRRRPWRVADESGRIRLGPAPTVATQGAIA